MKQQGPLALNERNEARMHLRMAVRAKQRALLRLSPHAVPAAGILRHLKVLVARREMVKLQSSDTAIIATQLTAPAQVSHRQAFEFLAPLHHTARLAGGDILAMASRILFGANTANPQRFSPLRMQSPSVVATKWRANQAIASFRR